MNTIQSNFRINANFNIHSKNLYLTYPKCDVQAKVVLENLLKMWPEKIKFAIISTEHHEDGELHLHLLIQMIGKAHVQTANFLDQLTGQHGNYQVSDLVIVQLSDIWLRFMERDFHL